jgi:hypothetical protein
LDLHDSILGPAELGRVHADRDRVKYAVGCEDESFRSERCFGKSSGEEDGVVYLGSFGDDADGLGRVVVEEELGVRAFEWE